MVHIAAARGAYICFRSDLVELRCFIEAVMSARVLIFIFLSLYIHSIPQVRLSSRSFVGMGRFSAWCRVPGQKNTATFGSEFCQIDYRGGPLFRDLRSRKSYKIRDFLQN